MRRPVTWILCTAVLLRLVFSLGYTRGIAGIRPERQVTDGYDRIAESLYHGHGYVMDPGGIPTLQRPPAYPLFLWGVFRAAGVNYVAVQIAQAFLGALAAWILYRFGRWVLSESLGLWAAGLFAVYFTSIEYSARLYAENLYFPVFLLLAWVLCLAATRASARLGGLTGLLVGLSLMTRGTLAAFPPVLLAGLPLLRRSRIGWRNWPRWMIAAAVATILALTPWTIRNYRLTGAIVPVSAWGWAPFYHGIQNSKTGLHWGDLEASDRAADAERYRLTVERLYGGDRSQAFSSPREVVRHEAVARDLVLAEIRRDPGGFLLRGLVGLPFSWFQTMGPRKRILSLCLHLPLMVLFVLGARRLARRQPAAFARAWPAFLLIVFVNVFQAFVYPLARYLSPAVALSFLWSGYGLETLWRRDRASS